jgi:hypothetical protein
MIDEDFEQRLRDSLRAEASKAPLRSPAVPRLGGSALRQKASMPAGLRRWPVPVTAVLAAAAVAAGVVAYGPSSSQPAVAATAPMLSYRPAGVPRAGSLLPALAAAARRQRSLVPPVGGYLYQATETWNLVVSVSGASVTSRVIPRLQQAWSSAEGATMRETDQDAAPVAPGPLSQSEQAAARRELASGRVTSGPLPPAWGKLPLQPRALFRHLAEMFGKPPHPRMSSQVDVGWALENLAQYLQYNPPAPKLLTSVYTMIDLFPGVSDAGWVTDRAGRRGLAIAVPTGGPGYEHSVRLIVNPRSGRLLDVEDIQIDPSGVKIRTPFVFSYTLFLRAGVTSSLQGS